jgi:hypothetical protein
MFLKPRKTLIMKWILLLVVNFGITGAFCQSTGTGNLSATIPAGWLQYKDSINHFSFRYPADWTIRVADTSEKAKVFVRSPKEGKDDPFTENLNVVARVLETNDITALQLQKAIKPALESKMKNFTMLTEKIFTWNDKDAYQIEYTGTQSSGGEEIDTQVVQVIVMKNKALYTVTYVAAKNGPQDFYNKALEIINSFKIN